MSDSLQPHALQHARLPMSITISWSLLKLMSTELITLSNHLILCHLLLLLPSIFPRIRVFSNDLAFHIRWPDSKKHVHNYWREKLWYGSWKFSLLFCSLLKFDQCSRTKCHIKIQKLPTIYGIKFILTRHSPYLWKWKSLSRVQLFATPWTVRGILQARLLEWLAFPFSSGSSQPRNQT